VTAPKLVTASGIGARVLLTGRFEAQPLITAAAPRIAVARWNDEMFIMRAV
jgi:hypothetical protein